MSGGCKYHSKRLGKYDDWFVEPFELEDPTTIIGSTMECMPGDPGIDSVVELVPVFDGHKWCKREFKVSHTSSAEVVAELDAALSTATANFLDGFESEGSAGDDY